MIRILNNTRRNALFAVGMVLLAPAAASAQDAAATTYAPATLVLKAVDGTETQYQVGDVSLYVSSSAAYDDVPATTDLSLSLSTLTPVDAALLKWAAQTTEEAKETRDFSITAAIVAADGTSQDLTYEITGGHVTSFSAAHSTISPPNYSLSITADSVTLDGVKLN